ncbi:MAG: SpoIIE family protein phosphatase [Chloroflexi bacterium]|nr:SpoIIE family protein phosphatase [Chloroflexota bacterium]MCC6895174.1 serine/threonine-protein phosphatase [Anaerolineae bacterium]
MPTLKLSYGLASTQGSKHTTNDDRAAAFIWPDVARFNRETVGLFIIADAFNSQKVPATASQLAVDIVADEIKAYIFEPSELSIEHLMTGAFQKANTKILELTPDDGATLTAALLIGHQLHIAHVGDTRAYYINNASAIQLTKDHVYLGPISIIEEWAEVTPRQPRRVLYRALGQSETIEVDYRNEQLVPDSYLLLCTDGLINLESTFTADELLPSITNHAPQIACDQLIELAQKHDSTDDISVIVVKVQ